MAVRRIFFFFFFSFFFLLLAPVVHADHPLLAPDCRDKVALLPHIGSGTTETRRAMADMTMNNLLGALGLRQESGQESSMEAEL